MSDATERHKCYECVHRRVIPGDCHSRCNNVGAHVTGDAHGVRSGWFTWPLNFDPVWLLSCDGLSDDEADKLPEQTFSPLAELLGLLGRF